MKKQKTPYVRFGRVLGLVEVLPYIPRAKMSFQGTMVSLKSLRLKTFAQKGTVCSCCGLQAKYFAIERYKNEPEETPYHLNMYGIDDVGDEVLFTHDHTLARSLGGEDNTDNLTTMCGPCNWKKGVIENPNNKYNGRKV